MKRRVLNPVLLSLVGLLGCKDDSPSFVSLSDLCRRHAEDVCAARQICCEEPSSTQSCQDSVQGSCDAHLEELEGEDGVIYDSEQAWVVLSEQSIVLEECGAPFSIGSYFSGTRPDGESCTRDAECQSDLCDLELGQCVRSDALLCAAD